MTSYIFEHINETNLIFPKSVQYMYSNRSINFKYNDITFNLTIEKLQCTAIKPVNPEPHYLNLSQFHIYTVVNKLQLKKRINFIELIINLNERLDTLTNYCAVCDEQLENMSAVAVTCSKELCRWKIEEYHLGVNIKHELTINFEVTKLLFEFAMAALNSSRREHLLNPFPETFLTVSNEKDWTLLLNLNKDTNIENIANNYATTATNLEKFMKWIIATNRSNIQLLTFSENYDQMCKKHNNKFKPKQIFSFISHTPEREAEFQKAKKQYGTFFAYHGSQFENFHRIIRVGLKNYSNNDKMRLNGAVYGNGIYLSPNINTSLGYATKSYYNYNNNTNSNVTKQVVILCEVINKNIKPPNPHWVIDDETLVITRELLVF